MCMRCHPTREITINICICLSTQDYRAIIDRGKESSLQFYVLLHFLSFSYFQYPLYSRK